MTAQHLAIDAAAVRNASCGGEGLLKQFGVRMAFAREEEIFAQDEDADLLYQVVEGAVRTTRLMSDGRRQVGAFYFAGDVFGLESGPEHRFSAEALSDCAIMVAKRSALELAAGRETVDRTIALATAWELDRTREHLLLLGRKTACEKVASFLTDAAARTRGQIIDLPMGRQDMADYLGLTIETVSRMITQLQTAAVVEFKNHRQFVIRNRAALERLNR